MEDQKLLSDQNKLTIQELSIKNEEIVSKNSKLDEEIRILRFHQSQMEKEKDLQIEELNQQIQSKAEEIKEIQALREYFYIY